MGNRTRYIRARAYIHVCDIFRELRNVRGKPDSLTFDKSTLRKWTPSCRRRSAAMSSGFIRALFAITPAIKHYKPINNRSRIPANHCARARARADVITDNELFHAGRIARRIIPGALYKFD